MIKRPQKKNTNGNTKSKSGAQPTFFKDLINDNYVVASKKDDNTPSLRPKFLKELIGRTREKKIFKMMIESVKARQSKGEDAVLDHILLYGPPGLGKTTFATVIANEMGVSIKVTSGPAIEKQGDLVAILTNLKKGDILFIDEIHRLRKSIEEVLYPAMEDFSIDIIVGKGPSAQSIRLSLPKFTLIGATTRIGLLSSPLRDRFGIIQRLDFFNVEELAQIIKRLASIDNLEIDDDAIVEIAKRSRGTGRIAIRLYKRVKDYANILSEKRTISKKTAQKALDLIGVDKLGLDDLDRKILRAMIDNFDGGPVGIKTLSAALSEEIDTIEDVYEPYLIRIGFIKRTPRGRVVTSLAYDHLNVNYKNND